MALVFLGDVEAPVRCALELHRLLRRRPEIHLRMGIHTGPVYRVEDINAARNVAGGGINIAQRVMDCGDAGHILISNTVADVLEQVNTWKTALHDLGEAEVKHGLRVHLYNLYTDQAGNPELPQKLHIAQTTAAAARSRSKRKKLSLGAEALLAVGLVVGAIVSSRSALNALITDGLSARSESAHQAALLIAKEIEMSDDRNRLGSPEIQKDMERRLQADIRLQGSLERVAGSSPYFYDAAVVDPSGRALLTSNRYLLGKFLPARMDLDKIMQASFREQLRLLYRNQPPVLEVRLQVQCDAKPCVEVRLGVSSVTLRSKLTPALQSTSKFYVVGIIACAMLSISKWIIARSS
jgi:hypothetical protein